MKKTNNKQTNRWTAIKLSVLMESSAFQAKASDTLGDLIRRSRRILIASEFPCALDTGTFGEF